MIARFVQMGCLGRRQPTLEMRRWSVGRSEDLARHYLGHHYIMVIQEVPALFIAARGGAAWHPFHPCKSMC